MSEFEVIRNIFVREFEVQLWEPGNKRWWQTERLRFTVDVFDQPSVTLEWDSQKRIFTATAKWGPRPLTAKLDERENWLPFWNWTISKGGTILKRTTEISRTEKSLWAPVLGEEVTIPAGNDPFIITLDLLIRDTESDYDATVKETFEIPSSDFGVWLKTFDRSGEALLEGPSSPSVYNINPATPSIVLPAGIQSALVEQKTKIVTEPRWIDTSWWTVEGRRLAVDSSGKPIERIESSLQPGGKPIERIESSFQPGGKRLELIGSQQWIKIVILEKDVTGLKRVNLNQGTDLRLRLADGVSVPISYESDLSKGETYWWINSETAGRLPEEGRWWIEINENATVSGKWEIK